MRLNSVKALLVGAALLTASLAHAVSIFMKVEKDANGAFLEGESRDVNFAKQIEVDSMSWEATNPASLSRTSGVSAGKVSFSALKVIKAVDKASSPLMQANAAGTKFPKVTIDCAKLSTSPSAGATSFFKIELKDAVVSSYTVSCTNGDEFPVETVTFAFAGYRQTYIPIKSDGKPDTPVVGEWNVVTNTPVFAAKSDGEPAVSEPPVASGTKVSVEQP